MQDIRPIVEHVRAHVLDYFPAEAAARFHDDTDLLTLLDSLQVLRMLIALEATYSIKVKDSELSPANLGSVEKVAAFIARKCDERTESLQTRTAAGT